jgi:hypothetical protein
MYKFLTTRKSTEKREKRMSVVIGTVIGTSNVATTSTITEMIAPAVPPKNEIKVGMLVKVVNDARGYEGRVARVRNLSDDGVYLNGCGGVAFSFQDLQVVEKPKEPALVGDVVHAIGLCTPVVGRVVNVKTTYTYTLKCTDGMERVWCDVLPVTAEERETLATKRRNELLKIASDAMQELARIDALV